MGSRSCSTDIAVAVAIAKMDRQDDNIKSIGILPTNTGSGILTKPVYTSVLMYSYVYQTPAISNRMHIQVANCTKCYLNAVTPWNTYVRPVRTVKLLTTLLCSLCPRNKLNGRT